MKRTGWIIAAVLAVSGIGYHARAQLLAPAKMSLEHAAKLERDVLAVANINREAAEKAKRYVEDEEEIFRFYKLDPKDKTLSIDFMTGEISHKAAQK